MATKKPKYLSRFTFGSAVNVEFKNDGGVASTFRKGTVVAVKFTESSVFYDVSFDGQIIKDIYSLNLTARDEEPATEVATA